MKCVLFNGLECSLLVKHVIIEDMHGSGLYCFTNPLELGTRVSLMHRQTYVSIGRGRFTMLNSK